MRGPAALSPLWLQKEKLSAQASLKRHTSLNDLSLTRDEQEIEFLRLQVLEQQHVIEDLSLVRLHSMACQVTQCQEWHHSLRETLPKCRGSPESILMGASLLSSAGGSLASSQ